MYTQKLISELTRLYLPSGAAVSEALEQQLLGQATATFEAVDPAGCIRALVIPFSKQDGDSNAEHWTRLCTVANALQAELGLPAPAVSVSGDVGYGLWISLETSVPVMQAQEFVDRLRQVYVPDSDFEDEPIGAPLALPPHVNQRTGKWAAFIHPGLGASFADDCGLEMPPPATGQIGFLEGLQSVSAQQFIGALNLLRQAQGVVPAPAVSERTTAADGLLLKDATLEDIIAFLHSKHIEPTFRHLLPQLPERK